MKISEVGLELIKSFEGCSLKAYRCPANALTIGYGHTGGVKEGQVITQQQADEYLKTDLSKYEKAVNNLGVTFNQNQFDALVSFCYNLGTGIFTDNLLAAIKSKDWTSVAEQLLLYNKARVNGKLIELEGLTKRRQAESKLFLEECEEQVIKQINIQLNGVMKQVKAINVEGNNYVKLQDIKDDYIDVSYDSIKKIPVVEART